MSYWVTYFNFALFPLKGWGGFATHNSLKYKFKSDVLILLFNWVFTSFKVFENLLRPLVVSAEILMTLSQLNFFNWVFKFELIFNLSSSLRRSHLFSTKIGVQKFSIDSLINLMSSKFIPWEESTTTNEISEWFNVFIDKSDAYLSIWSFCFFLGTPAVSSILNTLSSKITSSIIESLVVPGMSDTIDLSFSRNALNNVDLPEFGFPIIEIAFLIFKSPLFSTPEY